WALDHSRRLQIHIATTLEIVASHECTAGEARKSRMLHTWANATVARPKEEVQDHVCSSRERLAQREELRCVK
mgnify:CR=1